MKYNSQALRELLCSAFDDEEFALFCADHFRAVRKEFTAGQRQSARAQMLVEYGERRNEVDKLLRLVKQANPAKYADFEPQLAADALSERLDETLKLYLAQSFKDDRYARLDQAGETDPDRNTLLHQVFVDLEVKPREGQRPLKLRRGQRGLFDPERMEAAPHQPDQEKDLSAMNWFLQERWPQIVVIGGPGHGKSTLGQYLAQVHRAILLKRQKDLSVL